ncbi:FAD-dependent oxidoreductase [Cyanothece sp. BG0011]|uniref:FAD-dependent oxidoreductase n=1 Tax=Cyanothece sp. BG0011 TaxID=2082950 RepID=UPI000D1F4070|nr:FAD-dependent oxidoreductase [Cyanothece sp. BG0011]
MKEIAVAHINDLQNGQMQQITVNNTPILLSKINDKFYATGAFCPHFGAPLEKGILSGERIVCPWHNACFNAIAGQQEKPPGLDSLFSYITRVEGEQVFVQLPEETSHHRTLEMAQYVPNVDNRTFVILGAGAAGINAVETLRQEGFQGKIIFISAEEKLPYDRTLLSKKYLQGKTREKGLTLRSHEFYDQYDIELKLGKTVTKVDPSQKTLTFDDNSRLEYDSLLLATGGKAKQLKIPGSNLANIFTLRQPEDVNLILETAKDVKNVLIIGSSFIGTEAAASLTQQGLNVTVVSPSEVPFKKILGDKLGKRFQKLHETNGVTFKLGTKAVEFQGNEKVESVKLDNGETIATHLVIVGIGVVPNTDYLTDRDLKAEDNSIAVNQYLQTNIEDMYAAGDMALFPYLPMEKLTRIEHWRLAAQQGRIAAKNMLGRHQLQDVSQIVPFFWSGQYNLKLRYVGHAEQWDEIAIDGNLDSPEFLAFYLQNNKIMAVAGVNRDRDIAAISELMRQQKMPDATTVKTQKINWIDRV